jgi:hypothetical protein
LAWRGPRFPGSSDPRLSIKDPELAHADFVEHCGGCHGALGRSAPAKLPELYGRVGWFMCTPDARNYLIRLPNIAHSRISDNDELADMLNYMVFVVGGNSAPPGTQPFTAEEVARERQHALVSGSLSAERARHAREAMHKCHARLAAAELSGRNQGLRHWRGVPGWGSLAPMHETPTDPPGTHFASPAVISRWTQNQRRAGLIAVALLLLAGLWTLRNFLPALGWAAILAISLWPWRQRPARAGPLARSWAGPRCSRCWCCCFPDPAGHGGGSRAG